MKKLLKTAVMMVMALGFVGDVSATYFITPATQPSWQITLASPTVPNALAWMQSTVGSVDQLYRKDPADFPPSAESGPYMNNYTTALAPFGDPSGGTIKYDGG